MSQTTINGTLIFNESFENTDLTNGQWKLFSSYNGWTIEGGDLEIQNGNVGGSTGSDGDAHSELDGHSRTEALTKISRFIDTPADTYTVSFDYKPRPNHEADSGMKVYVGDSYIEVHSDSNGNITIINPDNLTVSQNLDANGWTTLDVTVSGTSEQTLIGFEGLGTNNGYGAYLDDINVYEQAPNGIISLNAGDSAIWYLAGYSGSEIAPTVTFTIEGTPDAEGWIFLQTGQVRLLDPNTGKYEFKANDDASGEESFTYTVTDDMGNRNSSQITLKHQSVDYAELDPNDVSSGSHITFSENDLQVTASTGKYSVVRANNELSGKQYWEVEYTEYRGGHFITGLYDADIALPSASTTSSLGFGQGNWGVQVLVDNPVGQRHMIRFRHNGEYFDLPSYDADGQPDENDPGDIIGYAYDEASGAVWVHKNGIWLNGATEQEIAAGDTTNAIWTDVPSNLTPAASVNGYTGTFVFDDLSFEHSKPTGYESVYTPQFGNDENLIATSGNDVLYGDILTLEDAAHHNYAELNTHDVSSGSHITFSENDLQVTASTGKYSVVRANQELSGKQYWEVEYTEYRGGHFITGLYDADIALPSASTTSSLGFGQGNWGVQVLVDNPVGQRHMIRFRHDGKYFDLPSYDADGQPDENNPGDIIGYAYDEASGAVWVHKNGIWLNGATEQEIASSDTTNAIWTGLPSNLTPAASVNGYTGIFKFETFSHPEAIPNGYESVSKPLDLTSNDILNGLAGDDLIKGEGGDDILSGGSGNDDLYGGSGSDTLDGGEGYDRAIFSDSRSAYTIDEVAGTVTHNATGEIDTYSNIEELIFAPEAEDGIISVNAGDAATWHLHGSSEVDENNDGVSQVTFTIEGTPDAEGWITLNTGKVRLIDSATGQYEFKANEGASGEESFTYTVTDEMGNTSSSQMDIAINAPVDMNAAYFNTDNLNMTFQPTSEGDRQKFTIEFSFKRDRNNIEETFFEAQTSGGADLFIRLENNNQLRIREYTSQNMLDYTLDRDFSAIGEWNTIQINVDTTLADPAERVKFYINGEQHTDFVGTPVYATQDDKLIFASAHQHTIGTDHGGNWDLNGSLGRFIGVDGQTLTPENFGMKDSNGQWIPTEPAVQDYGQNGFYLNFDNPDNLGQDSSGNNNHFAADEGIVSVQTTTQSIFADLTNGNDIAIGGDENNSYMGLNGDDLLKGGGGNDTLSGGSGDDDLYGGSGSDILDGGAGYDRAFFSDSKSAYIIDAVAGTITHKATNEVDTYSNIEELIFAPETEDGVISLNADDGATWHLVGSSEVDANNDGVSDVIFAIEGIPDPEGWVTLNTGKVRITDAQTGQYEFKANENASGQESFTYTVTDEMGNISKGEMDVNISNTFSRTAIDLDGVEDSLKLATPDQEGNRQTWTWSGWIKPDAMESANIFTAGNGSTSGDFSGLVINGNTSIGVFFGSTHNNMQTTEKLDNGTIESVDGWYHLVLSADTTQPQPEDRLRLFINGQEFGLSGQPSQGALGAINGAQEHSIGRYIPSNNEHFDGQMADVHFVDGQALNSTDFGKNENGIWQPIDTNITDYGNNGFHLDFENENNLGQDSSNSGNDLSTQGTPTQINNKTAPSLVSTPTEGNDVFVLTSGSDSLDGLGGDDLIKGGQGNDNLKGGSGDDDLYGGSGSDILDGGDDQDRAIFDGSLTEYSIDANAGTVTHISTGDIDTYTSIETLIFSPEDETIAVNTGDVFSWQLGGRDVLDADGNQINDTNVTYSIDGNADNEGWVTLNTGSKIRLDAQTGDYEFIAGNTAGEESFTYTVTDHNGQSSSAEMDIKISQSFSLNAIELDNSTDSLKLEIPDQEGDRQTWTWSGWVKPDALQSANIFTAGNGSSGGDFSGLVINGDTSIGVFFGSTHNNMHTTERLNNNTIESIDGWYHLVLSADTTQPQSEDRLRLFVNGEQLSLSGQPSLGALGAINGAQEHSIGRYIPSNNEYFNGQMSDIHFVDGQALESTDFGSFDSQNVWRPIESDISNYGTNGFHLEFNDPNNLGLDTSPQDPAQPGNDLTPLGTPVQVSDASPALLSQTPTNGNDVFILTDANDNVHGSTGDDLIKGEGGNDTLSGGAGNDELHGGTGDDTFIFQSLDETGNGNFDTIVDFTNTDTLSFEKDTFEGLSGLSDGSLADLIAGNEAVAFLSSLNDPDQTGLKEAKATFIFVQDDPGSSTNHSALYYDADGSGSGYESTKIAEFENDAVITAADIEIITS